MAIANGVIGYLDSNVLMKQFNILGLYCYENLVEVELVLNATVRIV